MAKIFDLFLGIQGVKLGSKMIYLAKKITHKCSIFALIDICLRDKNFNGVTHSWKKTYIRPLWDSSQIQWGQKMLPCISMCISTPFRTKTS